MKTNKIRKVLPYTLEILLLGTAVVCFIGEWIGASSFSLMMAFGILAITVLLIWKNKYLALSIAILLGGASAYFLLALLSEFHEFPAENQERWQMLLIGIAIFSSLLAALLIMPKKYFASYRSLICQMP